MEMENGTLKWRCACDSAVLQEEHSAILLQDTDKILDFIISNPEKPAVEYTGDGMKICDFLPFQISQPSNSKRSRGQQETGASRPYMERAWTSTELVFRQVLSNVSKVPESEINRHETLYHLGLDSISAIKVASNLRQHSINLSVGEMLKAADIEGMARLVGARSTQDSIFSSRDTIQSALSRLELDKSLRIAGIDLGEVEKVLPATAGQIYMLSMWQKSRGQLYFPTFRYQCSTDLHPGRLKNAWKQLTNHLSILRTTFVSTQDPSIPFIQAVLKDTQKSVDWNDRDGFNSVSPNSALLELKVRQLQQQFVASFRVHHALYDGVSLPIIIRQLETFYNEDSPPSDPQLKYEDFLALGLDDTSKMKGKEFWCSYFKDFVGLHLCLEKEKDSILQSDRRALFQPALLTSTEPLLKFSRLTGLSIQSLFLAIYAKIYYEHLYSSSQIEHPTQGIVLGIYLANRSSLDGLTSLPYPTFNLLPLRIDRPFSQPILDTARWIQEHVQKISEPPNARVGLWEIESWTGVRVDCFVNFLSLPDSGDETDGHNAKGLRLREIKTDWEMVGGIKEQDLDQEKAFINLPGAENSVLDKFGVRGLLQDSRI